MFANKSSKCGSNSEYKLTPSFTSRTRNLDFPFESVPVSYFGCVDCDYKVRQFSYRRSGAMSLSRRNSFARSRRRATTARRR
jgi:hypothetical protein